MKILKFGGSSIGTSERIENVNGAYFAIDSIEVVPVVLPRRPR